MENSDIQVVERRSSRIFSRVIFFSLVLSFFIVYLAGDYLTGNRYISNFIDFIGEMIPAVNVVSNKTDCVRLARISIASQWLFFPIYVLLLCLMQPFWKTFKPKRYVPPKVQKNGIVASAFLFIFCVPLVMADFGILNGSILRGSFFDPSYGMFFLRLPFAGKFGLAAASFMMPFLSAFIYWFLLFSIGVVIRFLWRSARNI